jgi:hypothetical protein
VRREQAAGAGRQHKGRNADQSDDTGSDTDQGEATARFAVAADFGR